MDLFSASIHLAWTSLLGDLNVSLNLVFSLHSGKSSRWATKVGGTKGCTISVHFRVEVTGYLMMILVEPVKSHYISTILSTWTSSLKMYDSTLELSFVFCDLWSITPGAIVFLSTPSIIINYMSSITVFIQIKIVHRTDNAIKLLS